MWVWSHIFEEMNEPKFHIFLNPSLALLVHSSTNGVINNFGNPTADKHSNPIGSFEQGVTTNPIHNHYSLQPLYLESLNPKTNLRCSMACPTCSPKCTCTSLIYQSPFLNLPMRFVTSVTWNPSSLRSKQPYRSMAWKQLQALMYTNPSKSSLLDLSYNSITHKFMVMPHYGFRD